MGDDRPVTTSAVTSDDDTASGQTLRGRWKREATMVNAWHRPVDTTLAALPS
jgi:hypothetical protein